MSRTPLGVGVIGMGMMGKAFAQICTQMWEANLVGVSDVVEAAGKSAAEMFNVPFYADYHDLIAAGRARRSSLPRRRTRTSSRRWRLGEGQGRAPRKADRRYRRRRT